MVKKLVKHGNSFALLIEKPILKMMGIDETSDLDITLEGTSLIIRLSNFKTKKPKTRKEEIKEIAKEIMEEYDVVFRKLSKT